MSHWADPDLRDAFVERVLQAKSSGRFRVWLAYYNIHRKYVPGYADALEKVKRLTKCSAYQTDDFNDFAPDIHEGGLGSEEQYRQCLNREKAYVWHNLMFKIAMRSQRYSPGFTQTMLALRRSWPQAFSGRRGCRVA